MFIAGEVVSYPSGTTLSPTSVPNGKKIAGSVSSVKQVTETASNSSAVAIAMSRATSQAKSIHCIVVNRHPPPENCAEKWKRCAKFMKKMAPTVMKFSPKLRARYTVVAYKCGQDSFR